MPWNENKGDVDVEDDTPKANGGPWGSGGSTNGNGGSPWNRPGAGGKGSDLEDQVRKMQQRFGGGGNGGGSGKGLNIGPGGLVWLALAAAISWLATGIVVVDEGQRAAVFRFGQYQTNFTPGFHIHLPAPIETHEILPAETQQETTIGSTSAESLMLTGDENIVDVQFRVFWFYDREHPENFILNIDRGGLLVSDAAESVMREVVGKSALNAVLTDGRVQIQTSVKEQLQALLDDYRGGVQVENVEIQDARAPVPVRDAFIDVINAGQDAERAVQEAIRFNNDIVPRARGEAQRILQDAQAYRDQVVADATGQADRFTQILSEYRKAPRVTRERMYLETMERVLSRSEIMILDQDAGAVPYLPLERLNTENGR